MRLSFLLRVDPIKLADGHLVGEIEEVMTGQVGGVHSPADIVSFCASAAGVAAAGVTGAGASRSDNSTGGQW